MKIKCAFTKMVPLSDLREHPKNRNKHSDAQITRLSQIFEYQGIRHPIIISNLSGFIAAGHGRLAAAKKLGLKEFPVDYQDFANEDEEYAFLVSDNSVALWAELDMAGINSDMGDLGPDFDIDLLGIKDLVLDINDKNKPLDESYTSKIESPIYEVKGENPKVSDLFISEKTNELIKEIESSSVDKSIKDFLKLAAMRHNVFHYEKIAEFYAHADKETQQLMENSALVIIDFKKAIDLGFVTLTKEISEQYLNEKSSE